jgi:hypothetical protein
VCVCVCVCVCVQVDPGKGWNLGPYVCIATHAVLVAWRITRELYVLRVPFHNPMQCHEFSDNGPARCLWQRSRIGKESPDLRWYSEPGALPAREPQNLGSFSHGSGRMTMSSSGNTVRCFGIMISLSHTTAHLQLSFLVDIAIM